MHTQDGGEAENKGTTDVTPALLRSTTNTASLCLPAPSEFNSDEPRDSLRTQKTEAESRCTRDDASALSLVPYCLFLHCSTRSAQSPYRALRIEQRRAWRLVAHTEDDGGEQVHEGRCNLSNSGCMSLSRSVETEYRMGFVTKGKRP